MSVVPAEGFPFKADPDTTSPLWVQLRNRIAFLISSGYLKPGDQLPKIRELAAELSINFNTVNRSYLSLSSDGYVKSVRGKGVFVCEVTKPESEVRRDELETLLFDCLMACKKLGLTYEDTAREMVQYARRLVMREIKSPVASGGDIIDFSTLERLGEAFEMKGV